MPDGELYGPQVNPTENLYRALTVPDWWDQTADPPRIRSFAFKVDTPFSVNVASLMSLEDTVRHMCKVLRCPQGGIVLFNCGEARAFGFDARHELDPDFHENKAHANVYYEGSNSSRKRAAKKLAECCKIRHSPSF